MQTYANTGEVIYDLPMGTNVNKPIYANISRPIYDKLEGGERLLENISSISNCNAQLAESSFSSSTRTSYWTSYASLPPPPEDWLKTMSPKDFDSAELNEVLTEGDRFLSMPNQVAESSKKTGSAPLYKKYRIAGSLCGVLGLGVTAGYFMSRQFGGNPLKETQTNLSFPSLQPSAGLPLAPADVTTAISPYSLPDSTQGIVRTEPGYTQKFTTKSYNKSATTKSYSKSATTKSPEIKPETEGNTVFEKSLHLPWSQQVKVNSSSPLPMEVIDEIQLTLIETKNKFFDMFKLDAKVIDKFTDKKLIISLYTTEADLLNTYGITPPPGTTRTGRFIAGAIDSEEGKIFVSVYDERVYSNIAYEYTHFLDAIFNGEPIVLWDDRNQHQLYRWWSDGLANYISGGCKIPAANGKNIEYAIKEGDPYRDGAKIHGFLDSNEQLKGIRRRMVKGFQTDNKKDAKYMIEYLIKSCNQNYKEWDCRKIDAEDTLGRAKR